MVFDYVKIDGEFIRDLPASHLISSWCGPRSTHRPRPREAHLAEFVGDAETVELLKRYGVGSAQGYYVAKPKPLEELDLSVLPTLTRG